MCCLRKTDNSSSRQVIYLLNETTGRGWGMWCGSWMGVDGECVCS